MFEARFSDDDPFVENSHSSGTKTLPSANP